MAYAGIQNRAAETTLKSDLRNIATQLGADKAVSDVYPLTQTASNEGKGLVASGGTTLQYNSDGLGYCVTAVSNNPNVSPLYITNSDTTPREGMCPVEDGAYMQSIVSTNCPSTRTRAVDARDNRTYWIQKLPDGKCWMLTNLAYAGGGTNTYGDVKTLQNGTGETVASITDPKYYVLGASNPTTEPTNPSTSTSGSGQYGYLYNWCAAMGVQASTLACMTGAPQPNFNVSICPTGWRLPTGNGGEFGALNAAVNGGSTTSDAGLRTTWLGQRGGWASPIPSISVEGQGTYGYYWSSTAQGNNVYPLYYFHSHVSLSGLNSRSTGFAVRCVAI